MNRKFLGIGLGLLTVALWIGPVFMAFNSNDWSLKKTVMPSSEEISELKDKIESTMRQASFTQDVFKVVDRDIKGDVFSLTFQFESPFSSTTVTINDIKIKLSNEGEKIATLEMEEKEVLIKPNESKNIHLSDQLTEERLEKLAQPSGIEGGMEMTGGYFKFEVKEVKIKLSPSEMHSGGF